MKILHISNFYYDRGGDCTHLLSLMRLLEKKGHKNIIFSMHHPKNFESEYSGYFVNYIDYAVEMKNRRNLLTGLKVLSRAIYSIEARKKIESLINNEKPDIAHIQSLHHHITPSILYPLKKHGIPVIWTLHDYALICPNTHFLCDGQICERCKKNKLYWSIIKRCKKGSLSASLIAMTETVVHRIMRINDMVDIFITPSNFLRNKLIEYGFNGKKIICLNNFIELESFPVEEGFEDYYLYVGRLTEIKGIKTLINAAIKAKAGKLKIVGDGALKDELMLYVKTMNKGEVIEFLGHKNHKEVIDLIKKSRFVVLPSECYENFPYSILESFACAKPVIGSRIGGIPELVKDYETGLTFKPGDTDDLTSKINYLIEHPDDGKKWGAQGRAFIEQMLNADRHYQKLIKIYSVCLGNNKI